jgi:hypothetical protein
MTLHTGQGCSITNNGAFSGSITTSNCYVDAAGQSDNAGCQITTSNTETYGSGFNSNNGGVYATEWTDSAISIYFFARGSIPSDITSGSPNPSSWGTPLAHFQGGCDIATNFTNQQIVFDTTFCGDWAGNVWSSGSCASKADTCNDYVENNPGAFSDAHWSVNTLQVYSAGGSSYSTAAASSTSTGWGTWQAIATSSSSAVSDTETSSPVESQTTFAVSATSTPIVASGASSLPPAISGTAPYASGNSSNAPFPTGSGSASGAVTGWAPIVSGTGAVLEAPSASAPAPSSPPEVTSAVEASSEATPYSYESASHTWDWQHNHHPSAGAFKRHMRQHKRHGAGLV